MSFFSRLANLFRGGRAMREIDDELQAHLDEAVARGRDASEARRAFGDTLRTREASLDVKLFPWLESLLADAVFGWRQLRKSKVTSAAAVLSLALAIGACTSAFRLIDAMLLRPLPIAAPERLFAVVRHGMDYTHRPMTDASFEYPVFTEMRKAVAGDADLVGVSFAERMDVTFGSPNELEKAARQFVTGSLFDSFGLRPAAGRLFTADDDVTEGAHFVAVLSYDYWTRRFGRDPSVIGRKVQIISSTSRVLTIIGVCEERFTGTQTGSVVDIFVPSVMHGGVNDPSWGWMRALAHLKPGVNVDVVRQKLNAVHSASVVEILKTLPAMPAEHREAFLSRTLQLERASAGFSAMQKNYRESLYALGALVALVLLIACANVANLMTARGAARSREMALRVAIGAGRSRLVQLVLVESAWIALLAAALGAAFAWWAAPFVVSRISSTQIPAALALPADWRVLSFGLALSLSVTGLFGLAPALRASAVTPGSALKGGASGDPHARRRLMHSLIALQTAFCFVVLFVAGLFVATFQRLSGTPLGFSPSRVVAIEAGAQEVRPEWWDQVVDRIRATPGVESATVAGFPLLSGNRWNGLVATSMDPPGTTLGYFLDTSGGWFETMKVPLIAGRDLRPSDIYPREQSTGTAVVSEAFAKAFFNGQNPIGRWFDRTDSQGKRVRFEVVGLCADFRYNELRGAILPTALLPFRLINKEGQAVSRNRAYLIVRTSTPDPLAMVSILREEIARTRPELHITNIETQDELLRYWTLRERLLSMLGLFFAGVALLLAAIGLYGVLDYSVLQRRREIGIRIAIGARAGHVVRIVTSRIAMVVFGGAAAGVALGMIAVRYLETLFFQVAPTDLPMLATPAAVLLAAAMAAAIPAVVRAVRIDPVEMLRSE